MKEAIVLAGGLGTRLRSVVSEVPKPIAPVNNQPFLDHLLKRLSQEKITRIVLSIGYQSEKIEAVYGKGFLGMEIAFCKEETPLGTGGALRKALELCQSSPVFVLNGDTFFDLSLEGLLQFHHARKTPLTIALTPILDSNNRYGAVEVDEKGIVTAFNEKNAVGSSLANGGVYVVDKALLPDLDSLETPFSLEKDVFPGLVRLGKVAGWVSDSYFLDMGTPEDYDRAQKELPDWR